MRQAERRRADLLKQAQSLTEVRVDAKSTQGLAEILEEIYEGNFYQQQLNLREYELYVGLHIFLSPDGCVECITQIRENILYGMLHTS